MKGPHKPYIQEDLQGAGVYEITSTGSARCVAMVRRKLNGVGINLAGDVHASICCLIASICCLIAQQVPHNLFKGVSHLLLRTLPDASPSQEST